MEDFGLRIEGLVYSLAWMRKNKVCRGKASSKTSWPRALGFVIRLAHADL